MKYLSIILLLNFLVLSSNSQCGFNFSRAWSSSTNKNESIFKAAQDCNADAIKKLANQYTVNQTDELGITALEYAIFSCINPQDIKNTIKTLVESGANPNKPISKTSGLFYTAMHFAILHSIEINDTTALETLINHKGNPYVMPSHDDNRVNVTPLQLAKGLKKNNSNQITSKIYNLLNSCPPPASEDISTISEAAYLCDPSALDRLLKNNTSDLSLPLYYAIKQCADNDNAFAAINTLISRGANPYKKRILPNEKTGENLELRNLTGYELAVILAITKGKTKSLEAFLRNKADFNKPQDSFRGLTSMQFAQGALLNDNQLFQQNALKTYNLFKTYSQTKNIS